MLVRLIEEEEEETLRLASLVEPRHNPRVLNVAALTKTIVRNQTLRRQTMFYVVLAAVGMLFIGATVFSDLHREHPITFLFYWAACGWLTILSVLMAIFDLLLLRAAARAARKKLEASILEEARRVAEEKKS